MTYACRKKNSNTTNPLVNLKPILGCSLDGTLQSISFTVYWLQEQVGHYKKLFYTESNGKMFKLFNKKTTGIKQTESKLNMKYMVMLKSSLCLLTFTLSFESPTHSASTVARNLEISKWQSAGINWRRTDNIYNGQKKKDKKGNMVYKTLHNKLKIEQLEPHKDGVNPTKTVWTEVLRTGTHLISE